MRINRRQGSIFLMALTALTVLFILGFSMTFFTGSEDWSSSITYESEVAFNLAEAAVEEFLARLKNALNNDDPNNQLYKVLRHHDTPIDKEIPLDAAQVARLTNYTRETARQIYGIQFGQGLVTSKDFSVDAVLKLNHINAVEAKSGNKYLYTHKKDTKEKQGEMVVTARVYYRGKLAKITLSFLIRVVKTFVPPFNYFTIFIKDGTVFGGSQFNTWKSLAGEQEKSLRLDNGWTFIPGQENFDAAKNPDYWEKALTQTGQGAQVPPGRIYLGQDPDASYPPAIILQPTNGFKLLSNHPTDGTNKFTQMNAQEGFYLNFDVPFMGLKDYVKKYMELQGQDKVKEGLIFTGWNNDTKIDIRNVGAGDEVGDTDYGGRPAFGNALRSYMNFRGTRISTAGSNDERILLERLCPQVSMSGLQLFGHARRKGAAQLTGAIDTEYLSPTLAYGPVFRAYYRISRIMLKEGMNKEGQKSQDVEIELPFLPVGESGQGTPLPMNITLDKELNATEARELLEWAGVPIDHRELMINNWDNFPKGMRKLNRYEKFMSNFGAEAYNRGLGHFLTKLRDKKELYDGPLKDFLVPFLANEPYAGMAGELNNPVNQSPVREFFVGDLWHALPDAMNAYLLDFYFIPRSTEDFFRGRTTVAMGGTSYDRFDFKYINDVRSYLSGANNQTLELNGILALNDQEPLLLRNLSFRGKGIIYASPMMGGGKVVIAGDFFPEGAADGSSNAFGANVHRHMMTVIAPQIVIDTSYAQGDVCYVEANLISVLEPLVITGQKGITIKGTVVAPRLNLEETFRESPGGTIIYNPLNSIWRNQQPNLMDEMYVAKIVTGGVGRFEWKYDRVEQ